MGIEKKKPRPPSPEDEFTDYADLEWEEEKDRSRMNRPEDQQLPFPVKIAKRAETQTISAEISTISVSRTYLDRPKHTSKTHQKHTSVKDRASLYHSDDEEHIYGEDEEMDCFNDWEFENESFEDDDYSQEMLMPQAPSLRLSIKTRQTDADTLWE